MKTKILFLVILIISFLRTSAQTYPTFGAEIPVVINGLTFDAMEPSITSNGNYIFFNSLNDGITTSLYYAARVDDSTFTYEGALTGANQTGSPRLDAVASSDSANNFYWVSTRDFPTQFDNYHQGKFNGTNIVNTGRLHGTFYIYTLGWLIMDAAINYQGNLLYYCNAYFTPSYSGCAGIPCQAKLGVAQKQNDTTFNKVINSDGMMQNINDTNYLVYAPFVTKDELELYYTRVLKSNPIQTEICVSVRTSPTDTFSLPSIIYPFSPLFPEAPTLTTDKSKMYYHKKSGSVYKLFLRYRTPIAGINESENIRSIRVFPNPADNRITIETPFLAGKQVQKTLIEILNIQGQLKKSLAFDETTAFDISSLANGMYFLKVKTDEGFVLKKFIKQ